MCHNALNDLLILRSNFNIQLQYASWSWDEMWTWKDDHMHMHLSELNTAIALLRLKNYLSLTS